MPDTPWNTSDEADVLDRCVPDGFGSLDAYASYNGAFAHVLAVAAAKTHPSWEYRDDGTFARVGNKGPQSLDALQECFQQEHSDQIATLSEALRQVVHEQRGLVPPELQSERS